jgi:hypothetical protein
MSFGDPVACPPVHDQLTPEVQFMQLTKRWMFLGSCLCMLVLTGVSAWGTPFAGIGGTAAFPAKQEQPKQEQAKPDQPAQEPAKSTTFTGTVVRDGEQFVLRDSAGGVFKLDDTARAQPFEGKAVKVTGRLDEEAKLIHVDSIEAAAA